MTETICALEHGRRKVLRWRASKCGIGENIGVSWWKFDQDKRLKIARRLIASGWSGT